MTVRLQQVECRPGLCCILKGNWFRFRRTTLIVSAGVLFFTVITVFNIINTGYRQGILLAGNNLVTCEPRTNVVFLKTHKCASSSIQNVLLRYGDDHNLTFVLPTRNNYFGHPALFQRSYVPDSLNRSFNILTHHTRYNRPEMDLLMPSDTVYVTIVRSPMDHLESMYSYYNLKDYYGMDLETMSLNRTRIQITLGQNRYYRRIGLNQMSFDLGFNVSQFEDRTAVQNFCRRLDSEFDLIMVYEQLEESLVLLSDLMCWSLEDVVVFKLNARKDKFRKKLSRRAVRRLKEVSVPDLTLYEYFSRRFQARVEDYGTDKMAAKVAELKKVTKKLLRHCVAGQVPDSNATDQGFNSKYVVRYQARNRHDIMCQRMLRYEMNYTEMLRQKQHSPVY